MHKFKQLLLDAAGALGISLTETMCEQFALYYRLLIEWNAKVNLTSLVRPGDVVIKHFIDSLSCLLVHKPVYGSRMVDIGTGAGFPGLPLKIARPDLRCTLIESAGRKVSFLHQLVGSLDLLDVDVAYGRAEELARREHYRDSFDLALARAVAPLPVLLEYTLPFLKTGGYFIALKGPAVEGELPASGNALKALRGLVREIKIIFLPFTVDERRLILIEKTGPTPEKYPRRPGVPARRPL